MGWAHGDRSESEMLQASEERYRQLLEAAPDPTFILGAEGEEAGRILDANTHAAEIHGYSLEKLLQMRIDQLDAPADAVRVPERIDEILQHGTVSFEAIHRHRDGSEFPVEVSARTARIDGRLRIVSFNRDIRERKRFEAEIRESQLRLDLAARVSRVGFWEWHVAENLVLFSDEWKAQLGYLPHELDGSFDEWRSRLHPDDLEPTMRAVHQHLSGETDVYETEFRLRHKDGSYRWIFVRGEALRDRAGNPEQFLGCHVDITERKATEAEREGLIHRLGQLQKIEAMGTLAGGIAHDFNNILSIISASVELLSLEDPPPESRQLLEEIQKAGVRAKSLVRQILTFSRNETPELRRVALASVLEEAVRLVRSTSPQRVSIESEIGADVPDVVGDAGQLEQVLVNLGTNAWHSIESGEGRVRFRIHAETPSGAHPCQAVIEVQDDGAGMSEELRARIFEPFFTTKSTGRGTGLGLSVVHGIVQNHGGSIDVESTEGVGTTFRIRLPASRGAELGDAEHSGAELGDAEHSGAEHGDAQQTAPTNRSTARVLLIDDEPDLLHVLARGLESHGLRVTTRSHPKRALETLAADPARFDVVVTDLDMPDLDGIAVAEAVRRLRPDMPVLLSSGFVDLAASRRAYAAGVHQTLLKPLLARELAAVIRSLPDRRETGSVT